MKKAQYCSPEILELRFHPDDHLPSIQRLGDVIPERMEALADRVLLYVEDGDATLQGIRRYDLNPVSTLIRRGTLEDVFLHLTGRRLLD